MLNEKLTEKQVDNILNNDFSAEELLSVAPFLTCVVNKKGHFVDVNDLFCDILGYSKEDLLKTPFIELVHPEDKDKTVQAYLEGNAFSEDGEFYLGFVNRYKTNKGEWAKLEWYSTDRKIGNKVLSFAVFKGYE